MRHPAISSVATCLQAGAWVAYACVAIVAPMGTARGERALTPGGHAAFAAQASVSVTGSRLPGRIDFARIIGIAIGASGATGAHGIRRAVQGGIVGWFASHESAQRDAAKGLNADTEAGSSIDTDSESEPVSAGASTTIYAGMAYEVHTVESDGSSAVVDVASHTFHSGDRFVVYVRPSLPGQMDIYNINSAGTQHRIDSARVAAGQLSSLGPYQFAAASGDEALRLVFLACSTPALLATTRDIVKVSVSSIGASGGIALGECGAGGSGRGTAHDIPNVAKDGSTNFALDPVSTEEIASGEYAAREVMIVFHHR